MLFNQIDETANFLQSKGIKNASVGIVMGTGLGAMADKIENQIVIPYKDIPNFPEGFFIPFFSKNKTVSFIWVKNM